MGCFKRPKFRLQPAAYVGAIKCFSPTALVQLPACTLPVPSACCAAAVHSVAFWRRQQADVLCFQLPSHALVAHATFCVTAAAYFCVLRSSMLSTAAERRLMVTPISCLESRKCSFLLHRLLLVLWSHKQKCSAPRDMSIGTLSSVWFGRPLGVHWTPPKMQPPGEL